MAFDFDELDEAEQVKQGHTTKSNREKSKSPSDLAVLAELPCQKPLRSRLKSRARTWFEIKRFFEADARGSPGRAHCARQLLLKTIYERLHQDGFVLIDCYLQTKTAQDLSNKLRVLGLSGREPMANEPTIQPWVGSQLLQKTVSTASSQSILHLVTTSETAELSFADQCSNCKITFSDRTSGEVSAFQPKTKEEFLLSLKAFLHSAADVASSEAQCGAEQVLVKFCFGEICDEQAEAQEGKR